MDPTQTAPGVFTNKSEILSRFPFLAGLCGPRSGTENVEFSVGRITPEVLSVAPTFQSLPYERKGPMTEALVLDATGELLHTLKLTIYSTGGDQQNYGKPLLQTRGETVEAGLRRLQESGKLTNAAYLLIRCGQGKSEFIDPSTGIQKIFQQAASVGLYVAPEGGVLSDWLPSYVASQRSALDALVMPARSTAPEPAA